MKTNTESLPRISTSLNSRPLTPSTLSEKRVSGFLKRMELMLTPFLLRLQTIRRAVGVPRSVKTVSKFTVSREKVSNADGDVVMLSSMHDVIRKFIEIKLISPMRVNKV